MSDWYDKAYEEFMFDGPLFSEVTPEAFKKVYAFLANEGLIDYDVEKEYLYDNYVEDEDTEEVDE